MKLILSARQHQDADRSAVAAGMPSMVLMERAALACASEIEKRQYDMDRVLVVCGTGNNGGDGVAVARILCEEGYSCTVFLAGPEEKFSEQLKQQLHIIEGFPIPVIRARRMPGEELADFHPEDYSLIIDALFGIGLKRDITGIYAELIDRINHSELPVAAVDMPSGVNTDSGMIMGTAVRADLTVTFTTGKAGLYIYPGAACAGKVKVKQIGIPLSRKITKACQLYTIEHSDLDYLPKRDESGNKGTFRKILVIAGSRNICGAAYLSAKAALLTGVGMVKIFTEENNRTPICAMFPEALISTYRDGAKDFPQLAADMKWADTVLIGPGLGTGDTALSLMREFLRLNQERKIPAVFDADALNLIAAHSDLLREIRFPSVFTPHVGEMSRLTGIAPSDIKSSAVSIARHAAEEVRNTVVLKDAATITALPNGSCFLNRSGNSALSTAGSGDVLTGIIAGLTAQHGDYTGVAAALGVYIHGKCGERASEKYSEASATAGNILEFIHEFL
ncbi:NAD(P)H-hydrate dehydratase [Bilifractor sp. LCP21S3_A7]|uniref:NAD(P)H-hydrate dehydratase n=1 Tax=Bilifractor sp. LCP21S3_A7 TaxID=3438738 RepID=UPI003F8DCA30